LECLWRIEACARVEPGVPDKAVEWRRRILRGRDVDRAHIEADIVEPGVTRRNRSVLRNARVPEQRDLIPATHGQQSGQNDRATSHHMGSLREDDGALVVVAVARTGTLRRAEVPIVVTPPSIS
jgi:hypothetical protein